MATTCKGTTQKEKPCKNKTTSEYCHFHSKDVVVAPKKNRKTLTSATTVPIIYEDGDLVPVFPGEVLYLIAFHSPSITIYRKLRLVSRSCHLNKTDTWRLIDQLTVIKRKVKYNIYRGLIESKREKQLEKQIEKYDQPQQYHVRLAYSKAFVVDIPLVGGKIFGVRRVYETHLEPVTDIINYPEEMQLYQTSEYLRNVKHGVELMYTTDTNVCIGIASPGLCMTYCEYANSKKHGVYLQRYKGFYGPYPSVMINKKHHTFLLDNDCIVRARFENGQCLMIEIYLPKSDVIIPPLDSLAHCDLEEWADCVKTCNYKNGKKHGLWTERNHDGSISTFEFKNGRGPF